MDRNRSEGQTVMKRVSSADTMRESKILRPKTQWTPIVLNTILRYQFDATPTAPHGTDLDKLTQGSWSMYHSEASHIRLFLCGSHETGSMKFSH